MGQVHGRHKLCIWQIAAARSRLQIYRLLLHELLQFLLIILLLLIAMDQPRGFGEGGCHAGVRLMISLDGVMRWIVTDITHALIIPFPDLAMA